MTDSVRRKRQCAVPFYQLFVTSDMKDTPGFLLCGISHAYNFAKQIAKRPSCSSSPTALQKALNTKKLVSEIRERKSCFHIKKQLTLRNFVLPRYRNFDNCSFNSKKELKRTVLK